MKACKIAVLRATYNGACLSTGPAMKIKCFTFGLMRLSVISLQQKNGLICNLKQEIGKAGGMKHKMCRIHNSWQKIMCPFIPLAFHQHSSAVASLGKKSILLKALTG